jgi:hypothetical protein
MHIIKLLCIIIIITGSTVLCGLLQKLQRGFSTQCFTHRAPISWATPFSHLSLCLPNYLIPSSLVSDTFLIVRLFSKRVTFSRIWDGLAIDGVWIGNRILLTTYIHHSELQVITTFSLIDALYVSLLHTNTTVLSRH